MSFFWFQRTGGEEAWQEALSDHRSKVLAEIRPAFVTVLDASTVPEKGWSREQYDAVKYSGPFYIDWDAASIEEAARGFKQTLAKLKEFEVDLGCLRLYATGGRGFHLEVPEQVFMPKITKAGVSHLPGVYREMAMDLFTESMDMRVYTSRRGRMWRVPGVQRDNGKYKVPLTVEQALSITPELYDELCAAPRMEPERTEPVLNMSLSALFMKCVDKVTKGVKNRVKTAKDRDLLAAFKGDFPGSIKRVMAGEGILPGAGFNQIALQLAITANAIGKSADELVEACDGLIKNHSSDGRYNSPRRRKQALIELWHYTNESDAYSYSRGGIRALVTPDFPTGDLDGVNADMGIGNVPEDEAESEDLTEEARGEIANAASSLLEGISIQPTGIYKRTSDGWKMISNVSLIKPSITVDTEDGLTLGIEADVRSDGASYGRHLVPGKVFQSRASLSAYCAGRNGIFSGTDTQAGVIGLLLQRSAKKGKRMIYVVRREGLDLVQNPLDRSKVELDPVWISADSALTHRTDVQYTYSPKLGTTTVFNTDIHQCKPLQDSADSRAWMSALFKMNSPTVMAQLLGWFVSCFHKQYYQRGFEQFPLLHPNGPAGSGKTVTTMLMGRLFHNTSRVHNISAGIGTAFPFRHAWSSSASIPLIIDEYKPSELRQDRVDFLLQSFRLAYNQAFASTGGVSRGGADSSFRDITEYSFSAPTVFLGESQESQTAVVQRSVPVAFNPADSQAHTKWFVQVRDGITFMPQLGRVLLALTMGSMGEDGGWKVQPETVESRAAALNPIINSLRADMDSSVHDRQVFNLAVVMEGLNFMDRALGAVFGEVFRGEVDSLRQAVLDNKSDMQTSVMSEAAKVLNDMALISRTEDSESEFALREGHEYIVGDGWVEVLIRETFIKYFAWCKRKGFPPLYLSPESFITAMGKFPPVVDRLCLRSPLRKGAQSKIFRFDLSKLAAEGIEEFKSKSLA